MTDTGVPAHRVRGRGWETVLVVREGSLHRPGPAGPRGPHGTAAAARPRPGSQAGGTGRGGPGAAFWGGSGFRSHLPDWPPAPGACCGSAPRTLRRPPKPHRVTWGSRVPSILPARPLDFVQENVFSGEAAGGRTHILCGLACTLPESTWTASPKGPFPPPAARPSPMPSLGHSPPGIARTCLHGGSPSGEGGPHPGCVPQAGLPVNTAPPAGPCLLVLEATGLWGHRIFRHRLGLAPPARQLIPHDKEAKL